MSTNQTFAVFKNVYRFRDGSYAYHTRFKSVVSKPEN